MLRNITYVCDIKQMRNFNKISFAKALKNIKYPRINLTEYVQYLYRKKLPNTNDMKTTLINRRIYYVQGLEGEIL